MAVEPDVIAVIRTHEDITEVFRMMKELRQLTNAVCDDIAGMAEGHTDQILGPSARKNWGPISFDKFMETFAIEFHVKINMAAVKRMETVWEGRVRPIELSHNSRMSQKLINKAKPHVFSEMGKLSAAARMKCLTVEHRSRIARKAAKARWNPKRKKVAKSNAEIIHLDKKVCPPI